MRFWSLILNGKTLGGGCWRCAKGGNTGPKLPNLPLRMIPGSTHVNVAHGGSISCPGLFPNMSWVEGIPSASNIADWPSRGLGDVTD